MEDIVSAIKKAMSEEYHEICENVVSPYGDGHAAERIAGKSMEVVLNDKIDLKKSFYDLEND